MTPAVSPLSDDRDKALTCIEDVWKFCRKLRVGLFARQSERMQIALSEPFGKGSEQPMFLHDVTEWRDFFNVDMIGSHELLDDRLIADLRAYERLHAIGQVMHHYGSVIIPAPIQGVPTMLLCDGQPGQWRAYAVIADLNCYRRKDRGIKPQVTM
jgi:hypothetical protein